MTKALHPIAGTVATFLIAAFWISTVLVELFGAPSHVLAVKEAIPWGMLVLVPALAATGGTGLIRTRGRSGGLAGRKLSRMRFIAANGLLVLVPSALFLARRAGAGHFDAVFYTVQLIELLAGAVNLALLGLNMRDGLRMTRRLTRRGATAGPDRPARAAKVPIE